MKKILCLLALVAGCTHVDAGNVGVEIDQCSGGGVSSNIVPIGYHYTGPCTEIVEYPTYQQTMVLAHDESVNVTSSEGLPISADVSLSFTVNGAKVPNIYQKYRLDLEHIQHTFFRQSIREAMQEVSAKYTAQQLYSDKREAARAEVQGILTKKFAADGFDVTQFTLNETRVPDNVRAAIQAKVAMVQEAQRAEQEVRKAEAVAKQKVATAEGDAQAAKLRADAEAYANQKLASSLSSVLVEYLKVQRWDGKMPHVNGGGGTLLQLK